MATGPRHAKRTVLVGVDGSKHSQSALFWAADYARRRGCGLHVALTRSHLKDVQWLPTDPHSPHPESESAERRQAEKQLEDLVRETLPSDLGIEVKTLVFQGDAAGVLIREAEQPGVEILVLGRRGRGGFKSLMLGSVSDQCATYGRRHTVVVPLGSDPTQSQPTIVVGIDGSRFADHALTWAAAHASLYDARLLLVNAWQVPYGPVASLIGSAKIAASGMDVFRDEALKLTEEAVARCLGDEPAVEIAIETPESEGSRALTGIAEREHPQLLVVGTRGLSAISAIPMGSVAHRTLHHAICPVAVVSERNLP